MQYGNQYSVQHVMREKTHSKLGGVVRIKLGQVPLAKERAHLSAHNLRLLVVVSGIDSHQRCQLDAMVNMFCKSMSIFRIAKKVTYETSEPLLTEDQCQFTFLIRIE